VGIGLGTPGGAQITHTFPINQRTSNHSHVFRATRATTKHCSFLQQTFLAAPVGSASKPGGCGHMWGTHHLPQQLHRHQVE